MPARLPNHGYEIPPGAVVGAWRITQAAGRFPLGQIHSAPDELQVVARAGMRGTPAFPTVLAGSTAAFPRPVASFDDLLAGARRALPGALADRLAFLKAQDAHLTEEQEPLSLASATHAVRILIANGPHGSPDLVVTPSGDMQVEWYRSPEDKLVVEFLPDGSCRFVDVRPYHPRRAGTCSPARVAILLHGFAHGGSHLDAYRAWATQILFRTRTTLPAIVHFATSRQAAG